MAYTADVRLLLLALLFLAGCPRRYEWNSLQGRECFMQCQRGRYQCNAGCFGNGWCTGSCNTDEQNCMDTCPDLRRVK